MQEATLVVDEQLLEAISLTLKSSTSRAYLDIGKDIDVVQRMTSPHAIGDGTSKGIEASYALPTTSKHSVKGPTSLKVAMKRLPTVGTFTIIPEVT